MYSRMGVWEFWNRTDLDGELGGAHHLHNVEGSPRDVVAQHLQLDREEEESTIH